MQKVSIIIASLIIASSNAASLTCRSSADCANNPAGTNQNTCCYFTQTILSGGIIGMCGYPAKVIDNAIEGSGCLESTESIKSRCTGTTNKYCTGNATLADPALSGTFGSCIS